MTDFRLMKKSRFYINALERAFTKFFSVNGNVVNRVITKAQQHTLTWVGLYGKLQ